MAKPRRGDVIELVIDDLAFGGAFYAIVDAEAAGVPIDAAHLPELRRLGMTIAREVEKLRRVVHPSDAGLEGIYGTIFTAPAQLPEAHLRNVTIFADAEVDRLDRLFRRFRLGNDRLGPAMAKLGITAEPQVTFYPAHEVFLPKALTITAT